MKNRLGVSAHVHLLTHGKLSYIQVDIAPSSFPVNYNGEYFRRIGSTTQQYRGAELTNFLISKTGVNRDSVPVEFIKVEDLDRESFEIFRREALRSGRMGADDLDIPDSELLDKLNLLQNGQLSRAAALCFYRYPDQVINGCYVKVGKFEGSGLLAQDEVHGSLLYIADRVIDLIYLKYLTATISYEKDTRVETYPYPREAIREAVYNALIHSNWADNNPVQIRIESECMYISNSCLLPMGWTEQTLLEPHASKRFNPGIANVFYRAGFIEAWGRGIQKICDACAAHGAGKPEYIIRGEDMMLILHTRSVSQATVPNDSLATAIIHLLQRDGKITIAAIAGRLRTSNRSVSRVLKHLQETGKIKRVGGKPRGEWMVCDEV